MARTTLLDIVKANGMDAMAGLIDEVQTLHPEVKYGDARKITGIMYKTLVTVALPNVLGSFRAANQGTPPLKPTREMRTVECFIGEPRSETDKAIADSYEDGAAEYIAMDQKDILEGEMQGLGTQFYYGRNSGNANAQGFPGLIDMYDPVNMVLDAGGTTAGTGSSVWMVKFGKGNVQWVFGNNGQMSWSPLRIESIIDPNNTSNRFVGYVSELLYRPGLQVGSLRSCVRIKKLTNDAGSTLNDKFLNDALTLFRAGMQPDAIFMSRRSLGQLRDSRTAVNPTGEAAPFPAKIQGIAGQDIPLFATDSIINTEALTL